MEFLRKYGAFFLLLGIGSDLLTPYILGFFYPKMNQLKMVISEFGEVGSPVKTAFLLWSILSGIFFVLSLPSIYQTFKDTSFLWAGIITSAVGLYGIADCIFTGLFSIDNQEKTWNLATWIHNIGSGVGYAGFLLFPFFLFILYRIQKNFDQSNLYMFLFVLSLLAAGMYGLARLPMSNRWPLFNQLGLLQRISFLFNYLPMVVFSVHQLKNSLFC